MNHKRKDWERVNRWREGNVQYEEYQVVKTVVLPADQRPAATASVEPAAATPIVQNKQAVAAKHDQDSKDGDSNKDNGDKPSQPEHTSAGQEHVAASTSKTAPKAQNTESTNKNESSDKEDSPAKTESKGNTGNCPVGGSAEDWANEPCSGGKSIEESFNTMRSKWMPSLANSPMKWSAKLAANARLTTVSPVVTKNGKKENMGGAMEMNHALNPGSMAQCIASGDGTSMNGGLTPFEQALKMWLCELPQAGNPLGCSNSGNQGDTGHAEIIKSTQYKSFGAYYMDSTGRSGFKGMWTADFA